MRFLYLFFSYLFLFFNNFFCQNREDIETLRALVLLNENLKKQDEQFRLNCKQQRQLLQEKIKSIQDVEYVKFCFSFLIVFFFNLNFY